MGAEGLWEVLRGVLFMACNSSQGNVAVSEHAAPGRAELAHRGVVKGNIEADLFNRFKKLRT